MSNKIQPPADNLPRRRKRFIGRSNELSRLDEAVESHQLVTIVGGGGIGKTRLAMHYAATASRYEEIVFCDLSDARSVEDLISRVATSLNLEMTSTSHPTQLGVLLERLGPVLLILDNLEQVVEPAAHAVGIWMDQARNVTFLATSREPLHVRGERRFQLSPLSHEEAIDLFEHRAQRARPDFEVGPENRSDVVQIIERLDGLPLAIELAACRINVLSPEDIRRRLTGEHSGLHTLTRKTRNATARHQTMHSTLQWSWELLDEVERRVLAGASVFRGGFDLQAAEAVLGVEGAPADGAHFRIEDILESLTDKSLVNALPASNSNARPGRRFEMYTTISGFARMKLEDEQRRHVERAHARYYVELLEQKRASRPIEESGNIEQAFRTSVGREDELAARAALQTYRLLRERGLYRKIFEIVDEALQGSFRDTALRARLLEARAACRYEHGQYREAIRDIEKGLDALPDDDRSETRAFLLFRKATALRAQGRPEAAASPLEKALDIAEARNDLRGMARIVTAQATVDFELGDIRQARTKLTEQLELIHHDELADLAANTMLELVRCENQLGDLQAAESHLERAWKLHPDKTRKFRLNWAEQRGTLAWFRGKDDQARRCFRRALEDDASIDGDRRMIPIRFGLSAVDSTPEGTSTESHLRDILGMVRETEDGFHRIEARTRLAVECLRNRTFGEATGLLARAAEEADELGDDREAAHVRAWWAVAEAGLGNSQHCGRLLEDARERHEGVNDQVLAEDTDYFRRVVSILGDQAPTDGQQRDDAIADLRAESKSRLFQPETRLWRWPCYDHLSELADVLEGATDSASSEDTLCVARDGSAMVLPNGEFVDLSSRDALRRIIGELAKRRDGAPGGGMSVEKLLSLGWPEARVTADSGASRVYTAIRNLRSMGLDDILLTGHNGYFLDPDIPFDWLD